MADKVEDTSRKISTQRFFKFNAIVRCVTIYNIFTTCIIFKYNNKYCEKLCGHGIFFRPEDAFVIYSNIIGSVRKLGAV